MIDEDLQAFVEDFGSEYTFKRVALPTHTTLFTATCILDAPPDDIEVYDRSFYDEKHYAAKVKVARSVLTAVAADVPGLRLNDYVVIDSVNWYVGDIEPDGQGMIQIFISKNQA